MSEFFKNALPVFAKDLEKEINVTIGLYAKTEYFSGDSVKLNIAAASLYRLYINGEFYTCGPARCGHGYYRVDELDLSSSLKDGINHISIEVTGYNVNSYYLLDQPSFVQCEIIKNDNVIFATGTDKEFDAYLLKDRVSKTQRYSFQRTLTESYIITDGYCLWRTGDAKAENRCTLKETEYKKLVGRKLPLYSFPEANPNLIVSEGNIVHIDYPRNKHHDRCLNISNIYKGYPENELEVNLSNELKYIDYKEISSSEKTFNGILSLSGGKYTALAFDKIYTGFIGVTVETTEETELYITFDERYSNRIADPILADVCNAVKLNTAKGKWYFQTAESYGGKYVGFICTKGNVTVSNIKILRYECPTPVVNELGVTGDLKDVWNAAVNTFRQNTLDIFMDCPTRERAGWLCDSFFTSRTEKLLTGKNNTERLFFENFALPEKFNYLPDGMLPMCYPADHNDGCYIPNWSLWFVYELYDYVKRGNNDDLPLILKDRVFRLLEFFKGYENEDGLLEKLDSWIFVEWSKANDFVLDVNYPTNMLYAHVLKCAGELYSDPTLSKKGVSILSKVNEQSFDGKYYRDHAVRQDGKLVVCDDISETCQYYAFFFNAATPETRPELWNLLINEFGPDRKNNGKYPEIHYSNAFIGNYLRLDILSTNGCEKQCLKEMIGYFKFMADRTGTLWENDNDGASCNHGFASYAAVLIDRCTKNM